MNEDNTKIILECLVCRKWKKTFVLRIEQNIWEQDRLIMQKIGKYVNDSFSGSAIFGNAYLLYHNNF